MKSPVEYGVRLILFMMMSSEWLRYGGLVMWAYEKRNRDTLPVSSLLTREDWPRKGGAVMWAYEYINCVM